MALAPNSGARSVLLTIIGTIATALLLGGWNAKESKADHDADINAVRSEQRAVKDTFSFQLERIKDILCEDKPRARSCR